jgi:hypothetical protein
MLSTQSVSFRRWRIFGPGSIFRRCPPAPGPQRDVDGKVNVRPRIGGRPADGLQVLCYRQGNAGNGFSS